MKLHQYFQQESRSNQLRNQAKLNTFGTKSENHDSPKHALWKFDITKHSQGWFNSRKTSTC